MNTSQLTYLELPSSGQLWLRWPHLEGKLSHTCLLQPSRIPRESEHSLSDPQSDPRLGVSKLCKGPDSKYLGLADGKVSVTTTQVCFYNVGTAIDHDVNEWTWLYSNKTWWALTLEFHVIFMCHEILIFLLKNVKIPVFSVVVLTGGHHSVH